MQPAGHQAAAVHAARPLIDTDPGAAPVGVAKKNRKKGVLAQRNSEVG